MSDYHHRHKVSRLSILTILLLISIGAQSLSNSRNSNNEALLNSIITRSLDCYKLNGLSLSVVQHDRWQFARTYGFTTNDKKTPYTKDKTQIMIASISKSFTAILVALLSELYKFPLNQPVNSLLKKPVIFMSEDRTNLTTFEDLLAHKMGINRFDFMFVFRGMDANQLLSQIQYFPNYGNKTKFRQKLMYSNLMYVVASKILERLVIVPGDSTTSFKSLMREHVFTPLGMSPKSTGYILDRQTAARLSSARGKLLTSLARSSISGPTQTLFVPVETSIFEGAAEVAAAAGVVISLDDMIKFQQFLVTSRVNQNQNEAKARLWRAFNITQQSQIPMSNFMRRMLKIHALPNVVYHRFRHDSYGMGWFLSQYRGHQVIWHGGSYFGVESLLFYVPSLNLSIFISTNAVMDYIPVLYNQVIKVIALSVIDLTLVAGGTNITTNNVCAMFPTSSSPPPTANVSSSRKVQPLLKYSTNNLSVLVGTYQSRAFGNVSLRPRTDADESAPTPNNQDLLVLEYGLLYKAFLYKTVQPCLRGNYFVKDESHLRSRFVYYGFYLYKFGAFWFLSYDDIINNTMTLQNDTCDAVIRRDLVTNTNTLQIILLYNEIVTFSCNSESSLSPPNFFIFLSLGLLIAYFLS